MRPRCVSSIQRGRGVCFVSTWCTKMKRFSRIVLSFAVIGLIVPQAPVMAANQAPVGDVTLTADGLLRGQLVNRDGAAKANLSVTAYAAEQAVGQSRTDQQGNFAIRLAKGGVYRLSDGETSTVLRVWTSQSAPPSAKAGVLMVSDKDLTRGQLGGGFPLVPILLVTGIAAGIAVAATAHHDAS